MNFCVYLEPLYVETNKEGVFNMFRSFRKINENAQAHVDRNSEYIDVFSPTLTIGRLEVDEENELFRIRQGVSLTLRYDELVDYKLVIDDEEVISGGLGVGRALVGGALAGGVGALLGGLTKKKITKKYVRRMDIQIRYEFNGQIETGVIQFVTGKIKVKSGRHQKAVDDSERALLALDRMTETKEELSLSPADELLKYKDLLDMDAITQDEFNEVKKKLLQ